MVNLFSFGSHVIDRAHVRTYASADCKGGVGETIKREGGVSQVCLGKSTSCILDIRNMVISQLSKQDSQSPVSHDHITSSNLIPRAFPLKMGGAGKGPGIGWSRVYLTP